jgi:phage terminase large subunit-like protein
LDPATGLPAHRLVVVVVPRRAGKSDLALAATMHRLFTAPDRRCGYLAQTRQDGADAWRDEWWPVIRSSPLARHLAIRESNGSEWIATRRRGRPSRARLLAPSPTAGHGKATDLVIADEAWAHTLERGTVLEAGLRPTQATRPGAQLWITSAAGTLDSGWLARYVDLGRAGAPGLAYFEWSADPAADRDDPATWAAAHPAYGRTVGEAFLRDERATSTREEFDRNYLGIWPAASTARAVDPAAWAACADLDRLDPAWPATIGVELSPDRTWAALTLAAVDLEHRVHLRLLWALEVADGEVTVREVTDAALAYARATSARAVALDPYTSGEVAAHLDAAGVTVVKAAGSRLARAAGDLLAAVTSRRLRHDDDPILTAHVLAAGTVPTGDGAVVLSRRTSTGPIAAAVAAALAVHAAGTPATRGVPVVR